MLITTAILSVGAVFVGFLFKEIFIAKDSIQFWSTSILSSHDFYNEHPPMWFLFITPIIIILAIPISYFLFIKKENILNKLVSKNQFIYKFLLKKWYFDELYNFILIVPVKKLGLIFWKKGDENFINKYGPDGLAKLIKIASTKAVNFQSGYLYHYAFVMLIGFSLLLTYLILN